MKKRQIMVLIYSMFFLKFVSAFFLPARGQEKVNCGRYPVAYAIDNRKNEFKLCLFSTEYNQHGSIYLVGIPNSEGTTIYKGKDGDAISVSPVAPLTPSKRQYGVWKKDGQYYLFLFPEGKIYIPIP